MAAAPRWHAWAAWLVPLGVLGVALGLRFASAWSGAGLAMAGCGLVLCLRLPELARRVLPATALLAAAIAATRFAGDALWPCPVSCAGGGHYQHLWGIPTHALAVAMLLAVAVLAWIWRSAAVVLAWVAAGASLYYLWLMWRLGLACGFCAAVHTGTLATALLCLRHAPPPWWLKPHLAALGFLGLHLAYHPGVVVDGPSPDDVAAAAFLKPAVAPVAVPAADPAQVAQVEARRRLGRQDAPLVLELAIDLHCPHCAESHGPLLAALRDRVAAGRLAVVNRFVIRRSAPTGRELAVHALAAPDAARFGLVVAVLLGTPEGRGWAAVRSRVAEVADLAALDAVAEAPAIDAVLAADGARLRALGCRQTPFAVLSRGGTEVARWQGGNLDPAAIAAAVDR